MEREGEGGQSHGRSMEDYVTDRLEIPWGLNTWRDEGFSHPIPYHQPARWSADCTAPSHQTAIAITI